jgi:hypothetical protein
MEKVIRVCEITGKVTEIAVNLDTATAMAMVAQLSTDDEFATYMRVVPKN